MKKILSLFIAISLVFVMTVPAFAASASTDSNQPIGYVAMSVDADVLGAGLLYEPELVPFYEGENYAQVFDRYIGSGNYQASGTLASGFYLTGVKLMNDITINIPSAIQDELDEYTDSMGEDDWMVQGANKANEYLSENDYFDFYGMGYGSGWMFEVDDAFADAGPSDVYPVNGDVCNIQFSLIWGSDLGTDWWGYVVVDPADKTELTWKVAQINSASNKDELLSDAEVLSSYNTANNILADLTASQDQVDSAVDKLNSVVNDYDELVSAKADAKTVLESYKNSSDYRPAQQTELANAISDGQAAIDAATSLPSVNSALSNAKAIIDKIKTDAQLSIQSIDAQTALDNVLDYLVANVPDPAFGSVGGEWTVLPLARAGYNVPENYYENYLSGIIQILDENNGALPGSSVKPTEYSRLIIALSALGVDVTNVEGYNLLEPLSIFDQVSKQGVSGAAYALIAIDTNNWELPTISDSDNQTTREKLIDYISSQELDNGGFSFIGTDVDPDLTSMVLQALAPYKDDSAAKPIIERALTALSSIQTADGGFASWGDENAESTAQVITALTALGIDPAADSRFVKENGNPITALLTYQKDGGFMHTIGGAVNQMSTEQAAYALVAYSRFVNNENSLFDMTDVTLSVEPITPGPVTPGPVTPGPVTPGPVTPGPIVTNPKTGSYNDLYIYVALISLAGIVVHTARKRISE
ncbi:MAG: hypothetical protein LBI03_11405 [Clostridiales bacterium]|nr:hypothetical protein [Clostridiales bacterium]